jgi:XTP/dITP diphosphohydrolase
VARPLLVATTNPGKIREVGAYLLGPPDLPALPGLTLLSLRDLPGMPEVPEDEPTFRGNAVMKAIEYSRAGACLALADDSGLSVDNLGGAPGVLSARFGGPGLDDASRCRYLLRQLAGVADPDRGARFECALALAAMGRVVGVFEGRVEGRILTKPRGENGFGYDPVFLHPASGKSFAEMSAAEKGEVSHRGRALARLRAFLEANPGVWEG